MTTIKNYVVKVRRERKDLIKERNEAWGFGEMDRKMVEGLLGYERYPSDEVLRGWAVVLKKNDVGVLRKYVDFVRTQLVCSIFIRGEGNR